MAIIKQGTTHMTYEAKNRAIEDLANSGVSFEQASTLLDFLFTDSAVFTVDVICQLISEAEGLSLTDRTIMLKELRKAVRSLEG